MSVRAPKDLIRTVQLNLLRFFVFIGFLLVVSFPARATLPIAKDGLAQFKHIHSYYAHVKQVVPVPAQSRRELLIIDGAVPDKQSLYRDLKPGIEVVELSSLRDGGQQLQAVLHRYQHLDAVHVVSHAQAGELLLGTSKLTRDAIVQQRGIAAAFRQAVRPGGDILLYGCGLADGQKGRDFIDAFHHATERDLAASIDLTGSLEKGGDWDLERRVGVINTALAFGATSLTRWNGLLVTVDFSDAVLSNGDTTVTSMGYAFVTSNGTWDGFFTTVFGEPTTSGSSGPTITLTKSGGGNFTISSFSVADFGGFAGLSVTVTGYLNSNPVASDTFSVPDGLAVRNFDNLANKNVDEVRFVYSGAGNTDILMDDVVVGDAITNNAPTISGTPADITVTEDTLSNVALSAVTVADADGDSLTLTLTASAGMLTASSDGGVTVANSGTSAMSLAGTAANINAFLDTAFNVRYTGASHANGDNQATLTLVANDGSVNSGASVANLDITAVNDDPTASGVPLDVTVTEDTASNLNLSVMTVSDVDAGSASVSVTLTASAGSLSASSGGGVTVSGSGTGILTLSGTIANIDTFFNTASNIQYTSASNAHGDNAATLTITANDGGNTGTGGGANVSLSTVNIDITAVNDVPIVAAPGTAVDYREGDSATVIDSSITLGDIDNATLASATVSITAHFQSGQDVLVFTNVSGMGNIAASYNSSTGVLTLTSAGATATLGEWQTALRAVTYANSSDAPFVASRTVSFVVHDGSANSPAATQTMHVTAENDNPTATGVPSDVSVTEDLASHFNLSAITLVDVDSPGSVTVKLTAAAGTFAAASSGGVTVVGSGTGSLTLTGTISNINAYLDTASNIQYTGTSNAEGDNASSATLVINDGNGSGDVGIGTINIDIVGTNDAPVVSGTFTGSVTEGAVGDTATTSGTLGISDIDVGDNPAFSDVGSMSGDSSYGNFVLASGTWTYTLNQNAVQVLDAGDTVTDTITYTATDGTTQVITITITGSNDAAVASGTTTGSVTEGNIGDSAVTASGSISINDVDGDDNPSFADVASTAGDHGYGSFVLSSGTWTYALDQSAVQNLDAGDTVTDTHTYTATDSTTLGITVTITGSNDAAVVSGTTTGSVTEGDIGDSAVTTSGSISITDVDADDSPSFADVAPTIGDNSYGSFVLTSGTWTYTLDQSAVQNLDAGDSVIDSHTYTATDGTTQAITITITGSNDDADVDGTLTGSVIEGNRGDVATATGSLTINDADGDDSPSFADVASVAGDHNYGRFVLSSGTWTYTLEQNAVQGLGASDTVLDTHTFTATDGSTLTVTITIHGTNDMPVVSLLQDLAVTEGDAATVMFPSVSFSDAEANFAGATLVVSGLLAEDTVSVPHGGTGSGQMGVSGSTLSYEGTEIGALSGGEGTSLTITLNASASLDAVEALFERLHYTNSSEEPTASRMLQVEFTDAAGGTLLSPPAFTAVTGSDNPFDGVTNDSNTHPVFVDIDGDGDLDAFVGLSNGSVSYYENTGTNAVPAYMERVGEVNPLHAVDVSSQAKPSLVDIDGDGDLDAFIGALSGEVSHWENTGNARKPAFTENSGSAGNPFHGVDVGDNSAPVFVDLDHDNDLDAVLGNAAGNLYYFENTGNAAAATFTERTGNANPFASLVLNAGTTPSFFDADYDGDWDLFVGSTAGAIDFYRNTGSTSAAAFTQVSGIAHPFADVSIANSALAFADINHDGSHDVFIGQSNGSVSYYRGAPDKSVVVSVTSVNDAPVIDGMPVTSVNEDSPYSFTPNASDVDSFNTLTYSITNKPSWASFSTSTGALTGTPTNADVGTTSNIVISVSDGTLSADLARFSLTVVNTNDAPTISGTPAVTVAEDSVYSFTPVGADIDVGDSLSFSISNKPSWASFDTATGSLSGTPNNDDVGTTSGIVIRVSDGTASASLSSFSLTVSNTNDAPVISGSPAGSVDEDSVYSFTPTASDVDSGVTLSFSIDNAPSWASFNSTTGALTGTPTNDDVGIDSGIVITVSDGTTRTSLPAFDLRVINTNDAPRISGTPELAVNAGVAYQFIPTATDVDIGDTLRFAISGQPTWANFNTATGELSGIPAATDIGSYAIQISVSDGMASANLPGFTVDVFSEVDSDGDTISDQQELLDGTDPNDPDDYLDETAPMVTAPEALVLDAVALYTPVSLRQLLGLSPEASAETLQAMLDSLARDNVDGANCCNTRPAQLIDSSVLLPPGRNIVTWRATDRKGNAGEASQLVDIRPLVSLSKDQISVEGAEVSIKVILNGPSPHYPFVVPYTIDSASTANLEDHDLDVGLVSFDLVNGKGQTEALIRFNLFEDGVAEGEELLIVRLDDLTRNTEDLANGFDPDNPDIFDINAGVKTDHHLRILEGNVPPDVRLQLQQGGLSTIQITPDGGLVTARAVVTDANVDESFSYDWSATDSILLDVDGDPDDAQWVFDPSVLSAGRYKLEVTVADSQLASDVAKLHFRVVEALPTLSVATDSDSDGVDDASEGTADTDDDGIPDYLDNIVAPNVLPEVASETTSYLVECDPGVRCRLGQFALLGSTGGVRLMPEDIETQADIGPDSVFEHSGGIFDFEVQDLPTLGQSVRIVLPQDQPIPAGGVYRKFQNGNWITFVEDVYNALHSAPGTPGFCPPPGDESWEAGLIAGYYCVQLTIEDGGPNDADGLVNGAVEDPGTVAVPRAEANPEPEPDPEPEDVVVTPRDRSGEGDGGGGAVGVSLILFTLGLWVLRVCRGGRLWRS